MYYWIVYVYLLFWIILSENIKTETLFIGIIICLLVRGLNKNLMCKNKYFNFKNIARWISYTIVLIKEIVVSNLNVAKIVLSPKMIITPQIITINTKIKSNFHKAIYANSITLTPGTLTISLDNDNIIVHCLKEEFAKELPNSIFEKIILKVEEHIYE